MTLEEKIAQSETHVFKTVFPDTTNHHNTMFGGRILLMMTEAAFMTATRFARKSFVIKSAEQAEFILPIPAASLIELVGRVEKVGTTSVHIRVDVFREKMLEEGREKAVTGFFTLVAINEHHRPIKVL
ncbi:acyl-CoA thioesterase [Niabella hibiscisoli]|uniref:acyl-CoA thioesterase n=1 Tax=Niabella hibiscisoli TaxID=1825928 RepID=UPI001F10FFA9|nr:hotdog domain-containing protein [Niabella hibiscisoli]MCH5718933.1 acyl-CoA thioesterase [Niabella hibiscisoli]